MSFIHNFDYIKRSDFDFESKESYERYVVESIEKISSLVSEMQDIMNRLRYFALKQDWLGNKVKSSILPIFEDYYHLARILERVYEQREKVFSCLNENGFKIIKLKSKVIERLEKKEKKEKI